MRGVRIVDWKRSKRAAIRRVDGGSGRKKGRKGDQCRFGGFTSAGTCAAQAAGDRAGKRWGTGGG